MKHIVIGTAGHIDHGKSALVRALTGTDPDRLKEEKARGITIDLGFASYEQGDVTVAFVDVPGHERFVKNMLAGATGIDGVLFVVAADESVMPQTREHLDICRMLEVPVGVIALTKCDLVDPEVLELVRLEVRELVAGTFLQDVPMVAVSARTREGLETLHAALDELPQRAKPRVHDTPARLPIDRVFSIKGFGTVVTGTLVAGTIMVGEDLVVMPQGRVVKVRGLQVHGRPVERATVGQRTAINLQGIAVDEIVRGDTLTAAAALSVSRRLDVVIELVESARPLPHGARVRFHVGTTEVLGRVALVEVEDRHAALDAAAANGRTISPGGRAYARVRLERSIPTVRGDRFVLRAYSPPMTIGGGAVLDPVPPPGATRSEATRARFATLDPARHLTARVPHAADLAALRCLLQYAAAEGLLPAALTSRVGLTLSSAATVTRALVDGHEALHVGDRVVARSVTDALGRALVELVQRHHETDPLSEGMPREEVRTRLFRHAPQAVFDEVVTALHTAGRVTGTERLALASHRPALSEEEGDAVRRIEAASEQCGLAALTESGLAEVTRQPPRIVARAVLWLLRDKRLARVGELLVPGRELIRLEESVAAVRRAANKPVFVDVGWFKERYGLTRKHAIPLLEYLDRERVTRRVGDKREIL
ncbi:MAG: selenocysteine-specific translation elongation factor [Luteitalea sp.]|nr:selenocysteine-specific translation elongation factor [Luteitalea sp.]